MDGIKNLIIAPHVDDEVLGCGGVLDETCYVYYCGIDESKVRPDPEHRIPINEREKEVEAVANFLGFKYEINLDTKVNFYEERELIGKFEDLINRIKPEKIFIPFPCYNQDHQAVYKAAEIALRPHDKNFFVKKVLVYEEPHSVIWENKPFKVNYFAGIDIERKIKAYSLHKSQVRGMRSDNLMRAIAKIRGDQSNKDYAEAFLVERWVE